MGEILQLSSGPQRAGSLEGKFVDLARKKCIVGYLQGMKSLNEADCQQKRQVSFRYAENSKSASWRGSLPGSRFVATHTEKAREGKIRHCIASKLDKKGALAWIISSSA
jgi:hypothetical protein